MAHTSRGNRFAIKDTNADLSVSHFHKKLWIEIVGHMQGDSESWLTPSAWAHISHDDARALAQWIFDNTQPAPPKERA